MAEREALSKRCQLSTEGGGEGSSCEGWQSVETPEETARFWLFDVRRFHITSLWWIIQSSIGSNLCEKTRSIFNSSIFNSLRFLKQQYTIFSIARSKKLKITFHPDPTTFPHFENNGEERRRRFLQRGREGRRKGADSWQEIPGDRKPGRCLWGPPRRRRRPLSVNGAESSPSRRGGDGCQKRISMTKGRWDAFSSLLLPRRGEGPPPLNSNAMGVCYANIPICC